jgi:hypothetical protein
MVLPGKDAVKAVLKGETIGEVQNQKTGEE